MKMKLFLVALALVGAAFSIKELEASIASTDYEKEDIEVVLEQTDIVKCYLRMQAKLDVDSICLQHTEQRYRRIAELFKKIVLEVTVEKKCTPGKDFKEKSCFKIIKKDVKKTFHLHVHVEKENRILTVVANQFLVYLEETVQNKTTDDNLHIEQNFGTEDKVPVQTEAPKKINNFNNGFKNNKNVNQPKPQLFMIPPKKDSQDDLKKIVAKHTREIATLKNQVEYLRKMVYGAQEPKPRPKIQAPTIPRLPNSDLTNQIGPMKKMLGALASKPAAGANYDWADKKPTNAINELPEDNEEEEEDMPNVPIYGQDPNRLQLNEMAKDDEARRKKLEAMGAKIEMDPFDLAGNQNLAGLGQLSRNPASIIAELENQKMPSPIKGPMKDGMVVPLNSLNLFPQTNGKPNNSFRGQPIDFDETKPNKSGNDFDEFEIFNKAKRVKKTE